MKNSAWYHKLWRKKLDSYSLKEDADTAWTQMQGLLDEHLPVNKTGIKNPGKFFGSTLISTLGFILPAAAMIGAVTFVAVKHNPFKHKPANKILYYKKNKFSPADKNVTDSLAIDSATDDTKTQATAADKLVAADTKNVNSGNRVLQTDILLRRPVNKAEQPNADKKGNNAASARVEKQESYLKRNNRVASNKGNHASPQNDLYLPGSNPEKTTQIANNEATVKQADGKIAGPDNGSVNKLKDSSITTTAAKKAVDKQKKANDKGSKTIASSKIKPQKEVKDRGPYKGDAPFELGLEAILNVDKGGANAAFGIWGSYLVNPKWRINAGLRYNAATTLKGDIVHKSFAPVDSLNTFKVTNTRKISTVSIPVTLAYKVSDRVSVNAGPQISFSVNQSKITNKLGTVTNFRDTLSHSHSIDSLLQFNSINKINLGISGGVSIRVSRFYIDGRIQQNITPYKVNTQLGNYQQNYRSFQIGIRYVLKKK